MTGITNKISNVLKEYHGQVLSSNDVVIYKMHENSSSKNGRHDFSFLAYLYEENFTARIEGFKVKFSIQDVSKQKKTITNSAKVIKEFNRLAQEDIEELVESSEQQGHSLSEFADVVRAAFADNLQWFGSRFYRTKAFKLVLTDPAVFYEEEES